MNPDDPPPTWREIAAWYFMLFCVVAPVALAMFAMAFLRWEIRK